MSNKPKKQLETRVEYLENIVAALENRVLSLTSMLKSHSIRINAGEELSLDYITRNSKYLDLSPEKAFKFYNDKDKNFILLDVSSEDYVPLADLPEAVIYPIEQIDSFIETCPNKATSILVISEDGLRSIKACEYLYKAGYFSVNNISGGYKYWPGHKNLSHLNDTNSEVA